VQKFLRCDWADEVAGAGPALGAQASAGQNVSESCAKHVRNRLISPVPWLTLARTRGRRWPAEIRLEWWGGRRVVVFKYLTALIAARPATYA